MLKMNTKPAVPILEPEKIETIFAQGDTFDPKRELERITSGRESYLYEEVEDFKKRYEFQTYGLAVLENDIVATLEGDLRTTKETLLIMLAERAGGLGLTSEQQILASSLIGEFMNRHVAVMDVYDRNGGLGWAVYGEVFGKSPVGEVEVYAGPSVLYFRCHNDEDYALIYSQKYMNDEKTVDVTDVTRANNSGGVSVPQALNPSLAGAIIAENAHGRPYDEVADSVYQHEKRHALNRFFLERGRSLNTFYEMKNAKTPEERQYKMRQYMRFIRSESESRAADEILAYSSTGESPERIITTLTARSADGGLYDYFQEQRDNPEDMEEFLAKVLGEQSREDIREGIKLVFVDEYKKELERGLESIRRLSTRDYTMQEIASILGRVPLTDWTKISRRLVAERYLPPEKFWLRGTAGVKVVVADSQGKFYGGVELDKFDPVSGQPIYKQGVGSNQADIKLSVEDLKLLNYPFKSAQLWYEVWVRSGGDPSIKDEIGFDYTADTLLSADSAWGHFRSHCKPDSEALSVFNTYRRLLREAY